MEIKTDVRLHRPQQQQKKKHFYLCVFIVTHKRIFYTNNFSSILDKGQQQHAFYFISDMESISLYTLRKQTTTKYNQNHRKPDTFQ